MKARCDFFAGYPITPASSILHYMLELVPEIGGTAIQAEDEIASMGFCIAAAMAGRKAMTATSGPGHEPVQRERRTWPRSARRRWSS